MLRIDFRGDDYKAVISWEVRDESASWLPILRSLLKEASEEAFEESPLCVVLPWWVFVGLRAQLSQFFKGFNLRYYSDYEVSQEASALLAAAKVRAESFHCARNRNPVSKEDLIERLREQGFARQLTSQQLRNVSLLAGLPSAATFSVPGAGKTTEALATYAYRSNPRERLLVVAPKNAFAAWDEQITECFPGKGYRFSRLRGGSVLKLLAEDPMYMIITYQQLPRVVDVVARHIIEHHVHVYLDESHRIKSGPTKQTAQAVLNISNHAVGKLIMSGTPMPQSKADLVPQFNFLYPEVGVDPDDVVEHMSSIYVRTTKAELGLRKPQVFTTRLEMRPLQRKLYDLMKSELARQVSSYLDNKAKARFRHLGRSIMRLMQFVSNPALISKHMNTSWPALLSEVLAEGNGVKIDYALSKARRLALEGRKVIIWSGFVENVEYIADSLADLGAVYIHGGVDAGDEDDDDTREGKIRRFHDDDQTMVLVANPAAASEGISLHTVCHHAIYVDRSYNAAHFLQSMDRIHRLGLKDDQETYIEVLECKSSIDESVRLRLDFKINQMAAVLEDASLRVDPVLFSGYESDEEWSGTALTDEDIRTLLQSLSGDD